MCADLTNLFHINQIGIGDFKIYDINQRVPPRPTKYIDNKDSFLEEQDKPGLNPLPNIDVSKTFSFIWRIFLW